MMKRIIGWAAGGMTVAAVVLLLMIGISPEQDGSQTAGADPESPVSVVIEQSTLRTVPIAGSSDEREPKAVVSQRGDSESAPAPAPVAESEPLQTQIAGSGETPSNAEQGIAQPVAKTPSTQAVALENSTAGSLKPKQSIEAAMSAQAEQSGGSGSEVTETPTQVSQTSMTPETAEEPASSASIEQPKSPEPDSSTAQTETSATNAQPNASETATAAPQEETQAARATPTQSEPAVPTAQAGKPVESAQQTSITLGVDQPAPVEEPSIVSGRSPTAPELQVPAEQTLAALANPTRDVEPVGSELPAQNQTEEPATATPLEPAAKLDPVPSEETPNSDPLAPAFDVVRVDSDGQTVIAGRAAPDEQVEVLLDGKIVGEARADGSGQFVAVIFANLSDSAQRLELRSILPVEQVALTEKPAPQISDEKIAPQLPEPEAPTDSLSDIAPSVQSNVQGLSAPNSVSSATGLSAEGDGSASIVRRDEVSAGLSSQVLSPTRSAVVTENSATPASGPQYAVSNPVIILPASSPDAAPTLVQPQREQLALLQPVQRDIVGVVLDSITYNDEGAVILSGRGISGRSIRIYANGREQGLVQVSADGSWRWASSLANPESIKLFRLDEIGSAGEVTSRVETPFEYSRLSPQVVRDRRVVIQQGDALWRIAEQFYGDGIRYSNIYGANSELIRDPDLIYPGQVFTIPELVDAN